MTKWIEDFFSSEDFMPHGHCFLWQPDILWLHVVSDALTAAAYFAIPLVLIHILGKRKDRPFETVFLLFAAFILFCGLTHVMSIWVLWHPDYAAEGVLKALTAIASVATFFVMMRLVPRILAIPNPTQLNHVNTKLRDAYDELDRLYRQNKAHSDSYLKAVVDTVLDGLITIDAEGTIDTFNKAAVRIFGYQPEEVIGRNVKMLMPEPYHSAHDGYLRSYLTTGEAKVIGAGREVSARRKDGSVFPMELGVNEMQVVGRRRFVGTIRDITERKEAENRIGLLAAIVESSEDAIISKSLDDTILTWNMGASHLLGYTAEEAIGRKIDLIIPPERRDEEEIVSKAIWTGKAIEHMETVRRTRDGRHIDVSLTASPIMDKSRNVIGASKIIRDISERKKNERAIGRFVLALKRSNQELDDFAHIASHDLKEPLRGLCNNALFLKEDCGAKLDPSNLKRIDRMVYLCERMERLVNDLLYFSRLGRQELAVQETDLNEIVNDIKSMLDVSNGDNPVLLQIDGILPVIVCDLPRVTEVFRNLITNAIKYNDKPEKQVHVGCVQKDGERVFYVRDNGIGIPEQFYQDVFRIFKRLNEEGDGVKGTGVGLTFVKKIIERHDGRIWIESAIGEGTVFYFTINQPRESDP